MKYCSVFNVITKQIDLLDIKSLISSEMGLIHFTAAEAFVH